MKHLKQKLIIPIFLLLICLPFDVYAEEFKQITFFIGENEAIINRKTQDLDAAPFIHDSKAMLPMRAAGEAMGMTVSYDSNKKQASFKDESGNLIILNINTACASKNDKPVKLSVQPVVKDSRIFVPIGELAKLTGYTRQNPESGRDISWYGEDKSIVITKGKSGDASDKNHTDKKLTNWFSKKDYPDNISMVILKSKTLGDYKKLPAECGGKAPAIDVKTSCADTEFVLIPKYTGDEVNVYALEYDESAGQMKRTEKLAHKIIRDGCSSVAMDIMIGEIMPTFEIELISDGKTKTTTVQLSGKDGSYIVNPGFLVEDC